MITDAILKFFAMIFNFIVALIPDFTFLESLSSAKDSFVEFLSSFIAYTLYLFNVPVLKVAMSILVIYITFIAGEYFIKLIIKYVTRLL